METALASILKINECEIQSHPELLTEINGLAYYITQKLDGINCTVLCDEDSNYVHVYSHDLEVDQGSLYWDTAFKAGVIDAAIVNPGLAFQGEIVGPTIQGNKLAKSQNEFYLFNIYDFVNGAYLNFDLMKEYAYENDLKLVPLISSGDCFEYSIDQLEWLARAGWYDVAKTSPQEGIVVRPLTEMISPSMGSRLSFKVISTDFLLQEK